MVKNLHEIANRILKITDFSCSLRFLFESLNGVETTLNDVGKLVDLVIVV